MSSTRYALGLLALLGCHRESPAPERQDAGTAPTRQDAGAPDAVLSPPINLAVSGTSFVPRSAYVVGPVKQRIITLVVSESPQGDCSAASAAMKADAITVRIGYGDLTSVNLNAKYTTEHLKKPDYAGIEPFVHLDADGRKRFLSGYVASASVPATLPSARKALYQFDLEDGPGISIKGELSALVCVTQANLLGTGH